MEAVFSAVLPYPEIVREAPPLKERGLDIEVEIQDAGWLLTTCEMSSVRRVGDFLRERRIAVSVNGPIFDLNPGSFDDFIRDHTRKVFLKTIELSWNIGATRVVLPSGFSPFLTGEARKGWLEISLPVWKDCLTKAAEHDIVVCMENRLEDSPDRICDIIDRLNSRTFGVCLNVGHVHLYSKKGIGTWVRKLGASIVEIHLSDNDGRNDDHIALGDGGVDFEAMAKSLHRANIRPPMILDMDRRHIEKSLRYLDEQGIFSIQPGLF
jgi:sugar phosphate isomerase/epimerase